MFSKKEKKKNGESHCGTVKNIYLHIKVFDGNKSRIAVITYESKYLQLFDYVACVHFCSMEL